MQLLFIKNQYYGYRSEIKLHLRSLGLHGRTYPRKLEHVPLPLRSLFEMVDPDFFV